MVDDSERTERPLSIGELAERTGVSRRTVRFYVQRGLIDPPVGLGRASHYTAQHAEQIGRVAALQRGGLRLEDISDLPAGKQAAAAGIAVPDARLVLRVALAPGVHLELDAGASPPTAEQIRKLAEAAKRILKR